MRVGDDQRADNLLGGGRAAGCHQTKAGDRGYSRDRDGDRDRDRYRRPEVVVRPSYRPGVVFGYGNRGYYTPPPPPCGFYDRWGYWHEDPGCYYGYPR